MLIFYINKMLNEQNNINKMTHLPKRLIKILDDFRKEKNENFKINENFLNFIDNTEFKISYTYVSQGYISLEIKNYTNYIFLCNLENNIIFLYNKEIKNYISFECYINDLLYYITKNQTIFINKRVTNNLIYDKIKEKVWFLGLFIFFEKENKLIIKLRHGIYNDLSKYYFEISNKNNFYEINLCYKKKIISMETLNENLFITLFSNKNDLLEYISIRIIIL